MIVRIEEQTLLKRVFFIIAIIASDFKLIFTICLEIEAVKLCRGICGIFSIYSIRFEVFKDKLPYFVPGGLRTADFNQIYLFT